ncbi:MAG: tetratricopeptide repeat protein, partial [Proteobacteria bacterium]|nr:tetratricopeptide repeat protein [Pseudomonadota bacterium]
MARPILFGSIFVAVFGLILVGCAPGPHTRKGPPFTKKLDENALMRLAEDRFSQERFQEAAEIYKNVLKNFPESPVWNEAQFRLALCYDQLDQPAQTVRTLKELVGLDLPRPRKLKIFSLMAESYLKIDRPLHT